MERAKTLTARIGIPGALVLGAVVLSSAAGFRKETAAPKPPQSEEVQTGLVEDRRPHPPVPSRMLPGPDPRPSPAPLPSPPTPSKVMPGEVPIEADLPEQDERGRPEDQAVPPPMGEPLEGEPMAAGQVASGPAHFFA